MAEAEDVLISAAERAANAARRARAKRRGAEGREPDPTSALLRLERWLVACFGHSWPLVLCDRPSPASWLRRSLDRPAPWELDPPLVVETDGARLLLPREAFGVNDRELGESAHLAALALGRRLAQGERWEIETTPLARDVRWALEAARGDAELATLLPGLAASLDRARAAALRLRPPLDALRSAERAVEELVRALLRGPARTADRVAAGCVARDGRDYRGVAPVAHWGVVRDREPRTSVGERRDHRDGAPAPRARSRRLTRQLRRRQAGEQRSRPGPFIVPPSDAQLAVQDPAGLDRPGDRGEEDLDALVEELSRLDGLSIVRCESPVREVLENPGASSLDSESASSTPPWVNALSYPEWDFRCSAYRSPGVALWQAPVPRSHSDWAAGVTERQASLIDSLRRQFLALRPRFEHLPRQIEGEEIDLDAWVDEHAERVSGRSPRGQHYRLARRRRRDLAVALLVDSSGSTDAWISQDARVIDVAKEAALCFSEALSAVGDRHAIYAFSGRGPGDVRVWVAKRFAEPLGAAVRARLGALEPDRSTRIGGPIRHVTAALTRVPALTRILLVLSDGKPNDDDLYEGEYGIEDVRQAVHEAAAAGVRSFCVTIDRCGSAYLPRLFGSSGYTLMWDAAQLPRRLPQIYRHLTRGLSG